jgi:hypothetical protein
MKRGRRPSGQAQGDSEDNGKPELVKSTYLLDRTLKDNLALAAVLSRQGQSDIVRAGIIARLREMGYENPTKPMKLPKTMAAAAGGKPTSD